MKLHKKIALVLMGAFLLQVSSVTAQEKEETSKPEFEWIYQLEHTKPKDQGRTGTCWSFATTSLIESEAIKKDEAASDIDLSEMFFARVMYREKAEQYVRYHGDARFSQGGLSHDVMYVIDNYGYVPEEVFRGNRVEDERHNHSEMFNVLKGIVEGVLDTRGEISHKWSVAYDKVLDTYLGEIPEKFEYKGKEYTPKSFADAMGINPDDYVELTSFSHHPFYEKFVLEIPDNWRHARYYNVPLDDLVSTMENAMAEGYTVAWDGDVGEKYFKMSEGYSAVPVSDTLDMKEDFPLPEKDITQEIRQKHFNSFSTTDDHLMHLVGLAKDENGTKYYYTKNSWGTEAGLFDGYIYMSEPYVELNTIGIMVHKDAVPDELREKLGF
jgi:bleomycin hydrolase